MVLYEKNPDTIVTMCVTVIIKEAETVLFGEQ